ncbi:P-loop containing nucleoside triphosphate hydrolase protein [Limtongia smithiae]|uniref:P-loop containing nucleoside triphosphate hydrolase protein n=1 Tax=Limtongia smithiae TaxID=1125753 RepID=UPI0034CE402E
MTSATANTEFRDSYYRMATTSDGENVRIRTRISHTLRALQRERLGEKRSMLSGPSVSKMLIEIERRKAQHMTSTNSDASTLGADADSGELWVEKWRAKKWVDLVGDERVHRQVLRWIQHWSYAVFKKPVATTAAPKLFHSHVNSNNWSPPQPNDPLQRPLKKLLLLHGPPGLGKTTVAHVAAKQAGYDVLEINASDERGGTAVLGKITGALESHRVGKRPVCIIVDEIDGGAESGFIRVLLDILNSDTKAVVQNASVAGQATRKKKKSAKPLLRPIIAICNDPYVSALRCLRPLSEVVSYKRAATNVITQRLREICASENLVVDNRTLTELVENMDGDMRGCVNTLQFDMGTGESGIGQKDVSANPNAIVGRVFREGPRVTDRRASLRNIVEEVERNGEFDKITMGCFALYPSMQYADDLLSKPVAAGDWLHFYDRLSHSLYHDQQRDMSQYLAYPASTFRMMFSSQSNNVKEYGIPKTDYEARDAQRSNKEIIKQLLSEARPSLHQMFEQDLVIATELAPNLMTITNPRLNPAGSSVLIERERELQRHAVDVMLDFGLTYVQHRAENSAFVYKMDPAVEELSTFSEQDKERAAVGKYTSRQLIAQELEREKMRRGARPEGYLAKDMSSQKRWRNDGDEAEQEDSVRAKRSRVTELEVRNKENIPDGQNKLARATFRSFFSTSSPPKGQDNNGHLRQSSAQARRDRAKKDRKQNVWVQFHDGFSNAVRKPIPWSEFWREI